jgi:serine/threonine protein kinase
MVGVLGRGAFSKVFLAYLGSQHTYFAMKSMRKDIIMDKDAIENINLERMIMLQVNHPFIVQMKFVF